MAERIYHGLGLSEGMAIGKVCLFDLGRHLAYPRYRVASEPEIDREKGRLGSAIGVADAALKTAAERTALKLGPAEAQIFTAQRAVLEDRTLVDRMLDKIADEHVNAEMAVVSVFDELMTTFAEFDDEYMSERGGDLDEVRRRLLNSLGSLTPSFRCTSAPHCQKGKGRIVVTRELIPMLSADLDTDDIKAFVTEHGGRASHAAILARSLGIPAVSGIEGIHDLVSCGSPVVVDGTRGLVIVDPSRETVERITGDSRAHAAVAAKIDIELPELPVKVEANINGPDDARAAVEMGADGVGLFRTEYVFMRVESMPDAASQAAEYGRVFSELDGRPATMRILDIGGDKTVPYLDLPVEENPHLGYRGSRLLLGMREVFASQVEAIASVAEGHDIGVMYPMVTGLGQVRRLKEAVEEILGSGGFASAGVREGVMFEVPGACLNADELYEMVDFGSIGTNDLTQYTLAVDRDNELVNEDFDEADPAVWRLIEMVIAAAKSAGKPVGVCGEMASSQEFAVRLAKLGVDSLSVAPRLVPRVKGALAEAVTVGNLQAKAGD